MAFLQILKFKEVEFVFNLYVDLINVLIGAEVTFEYIPEHIEIIMVRKSNE